MESDWPIVKIDDIQQKAKGAIAIGPFGSRMKSDCYVPSGIPVIRGTNITGGPSFEGDFVYITDELANSLGACNVYQNDLVFPHRGSIGEVGIVSNKDRYVISSSLMKLTCDQELVEPWYVYYFFKSHVGKHELLKNASQVGTPGIGQPLTSLKAIDIPLPPLADQKAIAHILGTFDDKIELNRQMNATLEAMAQALFKSWFVDFDPVIDNALAAGNPIPAPLQARAQARAALSDRRKPLPAAIQQQFPSRFVFNDELGWVPEGWEVQPIENLIDRFTVGKKFSQKTASEYGAVPILDQGKSGIIGFHDEEPGVLASPDDPIIVFANHTCYMRLVMYDFSAIQNVLPFKGKSLNIYWLYFATIGKQPFIEYKGHWPDFILHRLVVPSNDLDKIFGDYVQPQARSIFANEIQNESLGSIRDTLLPKLLSGQLRIPAAEKLIESVQ